MYRNGLGRREGVGPGQVQAQLGYARGYPDIQAAARLGLGRHANLTVLGLSDHRYNSWGTIEAERHMTRMLAVEEEGCLIPGEGGTRTGD